jgi:pimeloyl-ACP methyl ester carboxylesterase
VDERYSVVAHSDRIELLMQTLGETDFHIVGQGLGAVIGAELLARAEGRLAEKRDPRINPLSLYLINAPLFPELARPPRSERWLAGRLGEMARFLGTRELFRQYLAALAGPYSRPTPAEINHLWALARYGQGRRIWPAHARYHSELMKRSRRWIHIVRDSERPIGLAAGPEDPVAGHRLESAFRRSLPERRRHVIGKLGHTPQLEGPDKLLPVLRTFHQEVLREFS